MTAQPNARNWGEVLVDVAWRAGIGPDMNTALNAACHITGEHQLKRDQQYSWEEFSDRWTRSTVGVGLDYFREHGYKKDHPREAKYAYPLIHHGGRIPLYLEHFLDAGVAVKAYTDSRGIEWDVSDYSAVMDYQPCLTEQQAPPQFDMWLVNQKLPFMAGTYSAENPLLMDLAKRNSKVFNIGINRATAARKGIADGDEIWVETPVGKKVKGIARLTEGIHPECASAPGMFGRIELAAGPPYQALLVPDTAIGTEQTRKLVLVVDSQGTARAKYVTLGQLTNGMRVIASGIEPADKVIINGLMRARPGVKVTPQVQAADADTHSTNPPSR